MADLSVVEITARRPYPLRLAVLRDDTPTSRRLRRRRCAGHFHLGSATAIVVAISTWVPGHIRRARRPASRHGHRARAAGPGVGACCSNRLPRSAALAPLVWARARDTALPFYLRHGFSIEGDGFIDEPTAKPHHVIIRRLD